MVRRGPILVATALRGRTGGRKANSGLLLSSNSSQGILESINDAKDADKGHSASAVLASRVCTPAGLFAALWMLLIFSVEYNKNGELEVFERCAERSVP